MMRTKKEIEAMIKNILSECSDGGMVIAWDNGKSYKVFNTRRSDLPEASGAIEFKHRTLLERRQRRRNKGSVKERRLGMINIGYSAIDTPVFHELWDWLDPYHVCNDPMNDYSRTGVTYTLYSKRFNETNDGDDPTPYAVDVHTDEDNNNQFSVREEES